MTEKEEKAAFAALLIRSPTQPFEAALEIISDPDDIGRALKAATEWPLDPEVIAFKKELLKGDGELNFLPSKADFAKLIWEKMEGKFIDIEDFTKLGKLYADVRGFIVKPETNVVVNNSKIENKVIVVKDLGSNDDWENKAVLQQKALLDVSTSRH